MHSNCNGDSRAGYDIPEEAVSKNMYLEFTYKLRPLKGYDLKVSYTRNNRFSKIGLEGSLKKRDLIRVVENLDGTVESTDTIVKLKTKIENSSTFESDPDFVKTLIQNCIDERVSRNEREVTLKKQKIELAKLQLTKLEKEVELQTAKNKALSLNPAAKVEDKQFETNIEKMITSIKTLSLPVPTRSENFNLFFQSLERAFLTKKINDEYKSEILINLLGERAHNVLLYIKEEELNDYEKLKSIVLREFQLTPRECLNSFKNAVKSSGETYI
ncbi:integrase catalytic domain-containing protein [Trichonephila clavipes]|nr:integrase catalytic domain-containing protein [Trichonephila clavipes]